MARTFAATTDQLRFPIITQMTGVYSIGAWVRRAANGGYDTIYSRVTSGGQAKVALQLNPSDQVALEEIGVGEVATSTLTVKAADGWCFVGVHKPSGEAARAHVWKQASGWTHQNMATLANAATAGSSATVRIGEWQGGTADNFEGDIEVVVEYNGKLLGNGLFESLAFSRAAMVAFAPTGLWELRQASVEQKVSDLGSAGMNESVRSGTSVTTRSCPFYFAGGPPLYIPGVAESGDVTITVPAALASAAASSPSPAVAIGTAVCGTVASGPSPTPAVTSGAAAAQATAGAPVPTAAVSVGLLPATVTATAPSPVPAVLIGGAPAPATAAAPAPAVVVEEAPPSPLDLDVPTRLILEGTGATLSLEATATSLAVAGVGTALSVEDTDASLTVGEAGGALALVPAESTVVLDDRAEELILDG